MVTISLGHIHTSKFPGAVFTPVPHDTPGPPPTTCPVVQSTILAMANEKRS